MWLLTIVLLLNTGEVTIKNVPVDDGIQCMFIANELAKEIGPRVPIIAMSCTNILDNA